MTQSAAIFSQGSRTYATSSIFFPKHIREKVTILYAWVRTADNFVDSTPQDKKGFIEFRKASEAALRSKKTGNTVIDEFATLTHECAFEYAWIRSFLDAMEADLTKKQYRGMQETQQYMYGSAEVIGLFMARILDLPKESYPSAQLLGRAMQYINFIRDIAEDNALGRQYIPTAELRKFGLHSLEEAHARANKDAFNACMRAQIARYESWQLAAEEGYRFIPSRYRIAIQTAADMYRYTARVIAADPFVVYSRKVKPSRSRIVLAALRRCVLQ